MTVISVPINYVFLGLKNCVFWDLGDELLLLPNKKPTQYLTLYLYLPIILSGRPSQAFEYAGATVSSCHQVPWQPLPFPLLSEGHIRGDNHCCVPGLCWRVEQEPDEPVMLKWWFLLEVLLLDVFMSQTLCFMHYQGFPTNNWSCINIPH